MQSSEWIELAVKLTVYAFSVVISIIGCSAIDMNKLTRNRFNPNIKKIL